MSALVSVEMRIVLEQCARGTDPMAICSWNQSISICSWDRSDEHMLTGLMWTDAHGTNPISTFSGNRSHECMLM